MVWGVEIISQIFTCADFDIVFVKVVVAVVLVLVVGAWPNG